MSEIIFQAVLLILSAIGITEIIRLVVIKLVHPKANEQYSYIVLPLSKHCDDVENRIRAAAARVRWDDSGGAEKVICLDCGMDEETRRICEKTACDYDIVTVISRDDFYLHPFITGESPNVDMKNKIIDEKEES